MPGYIFYWEQPRIAWLLDDAHVPQWCVTADGADYLREWYNVHQTNAAQTVESIEHYTYAFCLGITAFYQREGEPYYVHVQDDC